MDRDSSRKLRQWLPLYLACYALWLGLSALGVALIFQARSASVTLALWFRVNPWQVRAIDQFTVVTMGLIWLVGVFLLEHYLRQGVEKGGLWRRAVRVFLFEVAVLGFLYAVQALLA